MAEVLTWYEIYEDGHIHDVLDLDKSIQAIQDSMFERNPWKYGDFLKKLWKVDTALKIMCIPDRETRVELFKCVYFAMRLIDDVVDGDTNTPLSLEKRKAVLESILDWDVEKINNPLYKALAIKIAELSTILGKGEQMSEAISDIIVSMNYDLLRIMDEEKVRESEDLHENFHRMDITWTIVWTAIVFWIDPRNAVNLISPLWEACRIMYNLRDFGEDIIADLINIPKEELKNYWISTEDLNTVKRAGKDIEFSELPQSIKNWFHSEIWKIWELLSNYSENMKDDCEFIDNPNWLLGKFRNFFLKRVIFPKTYINEINERIPSILQQVS